MTTRRGIPSRRTAEVATTADKGWRWKAAAGRFADGWLAEVFLDAQMESPFVDTARESAILVALALQYGRDLATIRHALDGPDVSPIGAALALFWTEGHADV
jgi:hypothetical protein